MALHVVTHVLAMTGLGTATKLNTTDVPVLPLYLPQESMTPAEQVEAVMSIVSAVVEAEAEMDVADCKVGMAEGVFVVGEFDSEFEDGEAEVVRDHKAPGWGRGKGMARLYAVKEV